LASFDSGGTWVLHENRCGAFLGFRSSRFGRDFYKASSFDPKFPAGEVLISRTYFDAGRPLYAMECPLDELVFVHRLATGEGIEVHAAGLAEGQNRAYYSWAIPDTERAPPRDSGPRKKTFAF
jgi:hypothetical protein